MKVDSEQVGWMVGRLIKNMCEDEGFTKAYQDAVKQSKESIKDWEDMAKIYWIILTGMPIEFSTPLWQKTKNYTPHAPLENIQTAIYVKCFNQGIAREFAANEIMYFLTKHKILHEWDGK